MTITWGREGTPNGYFKKCISVFLLLHSFNICRNRDLRIFLVIYIWFHQVEGTPERPRLSVFRSNKHLYVQVIDDSKMHTLASASTVQKPISEEFDYTSGPTLVSHQIYDLPLFCQTKFFKSFSPLITVGLYPQGVDQVVRSTLFSHEVWDSIPRGSLHS